MTSEKSGKRDDKERIVLTSCTHDCGGRCLLKVHVKEGVIVRIESDDGKDPELRACARGRAYRQKEYAPDRLKYPMKRVGARGEGKFERISWDEALDTVASELKRVKATYGPSAILCIGIDGSWSQLHTRLAAERLLNMFGGSLIKGGNVSCGGMVAAALATFGIVLLANTPDDYLNSRLIILWGWNPADTRWNTAVHFLQRAKDAGTKIVCVDPRCTDSAAILANQWIPIRPCTDTAMLIAMAYVIMVEGLQDQAFIDKYTVGFDQYKDYVLGVEDGIAKTPAWAEAVTKVPATTITNLAREYASFKPAALVTGWGPGRTAYGEQFHRAAMVLAAITGNIGIHGGHPTNLAPIGYPPAVFPFGSLPVGDNPVLLEAPVDEDRVTWPPEDKSMASIQASSMFDAILQGKAGGYYSDIKLAYITHGNPINSLVNSNKGVQAFQKLEFIVVHEQFMTATARLADIVLPVSNQLERNDITNTWMGSPPWYFYLNKAVDSAYECKTDLEICTELAARLGIPNYNDKTEDEWLREIAGSFPAITDYDEFRRKVVVKMELPEPLVPLKEQIKDPENNPFPTPSGKIEIYSQLFADKNNPKLPPIPKYIEDWEGPHHPLIKKYPLQVISIHAKTQVHSQFDYIPWLREVEPHKVWINSIDARTRSISDGDLVSIFNDRGKMLITCKVTERIMPGVICIAEGACFSPDENGVDRGGCVNTLTKDEMSPGGVSPYNTGLVQVEKA